MRGLDTDRGGAYHVGMVVGDAKVRGLEVELRQQAHYWRALHARATEREAAWKDKAQRLEQVVRQQQAQIAELTNKLEEALARVAWLEGQVFGRKSEQCPKTEPNPPDSTPAVDDHADAADAPEPGGGWAVQGDVLPGGHAAHGTGWPHYLAAPREGKWKRS